VVRTGISWELIGWRIRYTLARQQTALLLGLVGPTLIIGWTIFMPLNLLTVQESLRHALYLLAAWYILFTEVYVLIVWLRPRQQRDEEQLEHLPLSATQFFIHRFIDVALIPIAVAILSLPLFLVLLVYVGVPYTMRHELSYTLRVDDTGSGYITWARLPTPWGWRMFFVGLNLISATFLPLMLAMLLERLISWTPARAIMLLGLTAATYFVIKRAVYEYFYVCYRQTRGYNPVPFVLVFLLLLLIPFLISWLTPRGRIALGVALAVLIGALALLPYLQHGLPGQRTTATIRDALGDTRYALGYYICHFSPKENISLLLYSYTSSVLIDNHRKGDLIPRRVSVWVGAGLYPPLICVLAFTGMLAGTTLRRRQPLE